MIHVTRDRRAEATDRDAVISLRCDACGRTAPSPPYVLASHGDGNGDDQPSFSLARPRRSTSLF